MNSFKNPLTPLIANPVNIDRPIQEIQIALSALGWLEKSFGRAFLAYKSSHGTFGDKKQKQYPHVWQGFTTDGKPMDLLEVLPNDNLKSQSFVKVDEPIQVTDYVAGGWSLMTATISIIVWFNLREIDPTINYDFTELLAGQVQRALTNITLSPGAELQILRRWETAKNVFKDYDITELKDQELVYPRGGFRFECTLVYQEDCPDEVFAVPPQP